LVDNPEVALEIEAKIKYKVTGKGEGSEEDVDTKKTEMNGVKT